jgi:hypothetical protein
LKERGKSDCKIQGSSHAPLIQDSVARCWVDEEFSEVSAARVADAVFVTTRSALVFPDACGKRMWRGALASSLPRGTLGVSTVGTQLENKRTWHSGVTGMVRYTSNTQRPKGRLHMHMS